MTNGNIEITDEIKEKILESKLFDEEYYLSHLKEEIDNPLEHYLNIGYKKGYNPSEEFDTTNYIKNNPEVETTGLNPLLHYVLHDFNGKSKVKYDLKLSDYRKFIERVYFHELFDEKYYLSQYPDKQISDPLTHYILDGWREGKDPSFYFNTRIYLEQYPDVKNSDMNPLIHYCLFGLWENRLIKYDLDLSDLKKFINIAYNEGLFDDEYYLSQLKDEVFNPLDHYVYYGNEEGLSPSLLFDPSNFYKNNLDVKNSGTNPLIHYCLYGMEEDRRIKFDLTLSEIKTFYERVSESGLFDEEYYLKQCDESNIKYPLDHYVEIGCKEGKNPSVYFDSNNYLKNNRDVFYSNRNPFVHYIVYSYESERLVNHNLTLEVYKKFRQFVYDEDYFNDKYYLSQLDEDEVVFDSLEHYLNIGYKENYNPSEKFNTEEYVLEHSDLKENENPLIHYVTPIIEAYDVIHESNLFDEDYYSSHNGESSVDESENPLVHYITKGARLGLNPNAFFDTTKYIEAYPDVEESGLNPLYHFIKYGLHSRDSYIVLNRHLQNFDEKYSIASCINMLEVLEKTVSIIIPIYNAYEQTKDCIASVLRNTHINYELILINDCSTDKRINELLESLDSISNVKVINNNENQGFVKNVNMGMSLSKHDVVLLNSDTIVSPHWLSHLVSHAYRINKIGTVTPFSNATDISVPGVESKNDCNYINNVAYRLDKIAYNQNLQAPTGNGFCLFIKRALIDDIGLFDEAFGMGYGEETDFTFRAYKKGWLNIRDESVFVYHKRHASFSEDTSNSLKSENKKILMTKHSDLFDSWDNFTKSKQFNDVIERIRLHINDDTNPERILYVTDMENFKPVLDKDYTELSKEHEVFIMIITPNEIKVGVVNGIRYILYGSWTVDQKWDQSKFLKLYINILLNLKIDLLYVKYFYNFYNPSNQNLSLFIKILSKFEIPVLYESTTSTENLMSEVTELLYPMQSLDELIKYKSERIDFTKSKLVVYTAITGNYDELITPTIRNPEFDYICFTDNPDLKSNFWTIKIMDDLDLDPIRKARHYKILPHKYLKEYDYSLWIDANFDIIGDIGEYINKNSSEQKLLAIKHDVRDDVYEEARACLALKKDDPDLINKQINRYKENNYPKHKGLIASGVLFRNHNNQQVIEVMNDWYNEIINYSKRDQLSFNYVCWKNDFKYDESNEFYFKNQYFHRLYHTQENMLNLQYDEEEVNRILDAFKEKTSIIIPIYNAYEQTRNCIESVKKYTTIPYELLLINDNSTDQRIQKLLSELEKNNENIRVITNNENKGFVKNINKGFEQTANDVVILNSDTIVTPKWLQKLKITAYTQEDTATVTPLSNNAGAFSVPEQGKSNEINEKLGINSTANILEKLSKKEMLYVPTGNGFCMYIRRKAIFEVGFFDLIFGRGYCEENDFCMRLLKKGWNNVIDPSTYIYHERNVSFSSEKEKLYAKNRQLLSDKHPDYSLKIQDILNSLDLEDIRNNLELTLDCEDNQKYDIKRILYLIHEGNGGTLHTSVELMGNLPSNYESYLLTAGKTDINLYKYSENKNMVSGDDDEFLQHLTLVGNWEINETYSINNIFNNEFRRIYFNVLHFLKIDLVHIRHLIRHSFDMPYIAKSLGIPVILSFHDFYYICPSHNLIDDNDTYCGGYCTEICSNDGQCNISDGLNAPILKSYVSTWRQNVRKMFDCCDAFVTTSNSARQLYYDFYPELKNKHFEIIEHGRDIKTPENVQMPEFEDNGSIRILFPGHINVNKGGWLIKAIKEYDKENKLEYHYMGNLHPKFELEKIGEHHGYYKRSEFCKEVNMIKPHFIGILSIWPETYCHTLTESWGCGIPVLTLDIGALGERVNENGGGFFLENNPEKAYEKIISISKNPQEYKRVLDEIPNIHFKTTKQMAEDYVNLYDEVKKVEIDDGTTPLDVLKSKLKIPMFINKNK